MNKLCVSHHVTLLRLVRPRPKWKNLLWTLSRRVSTLESDMRFSPFFRIVPDNSRFFLPNLFINATSAQTMGNNQLGWRSTAGWTARMPQCTHIYTNSRSYDLTEDSMITTSEATFLITGIVTSGPFAGCQVVGTLTLWSYCHCLILGESILYLCQVRCIDTFDVCIGPFPWSWFGEDFANVGLDAGVWARLITPVNQPWMITAYPVTNICLWRNAFFVADGIIAMLWYPSFPRQTLF